MKVGNDGTPNDMIFNHVSAVPTSKYPFIEPSSGAAVIFSCLGTSPDFAAIKRAYPKSQGYMTLRDVYTYLSEKGLFVQYRYNFDPRVAHEDYQTAIIALVNYQYMSNQFIRRQGVGDYLDSHFVILYGYQDGIWSYMDPVSDGRKLSLTVDELVAMKPYSSALYLKE